VHVKTTVLRMVKTKCPVKHCCAVTGIARTRNLTPWSRVILENQFRNRNRKCVYHAVEVNRIPRMCSVQPLLVKASHTEIKNRQIFVAV
jgi:hypothetical protein